MPTYDFTFPYMIKGKIAAEFDARCSFSATLGREPSGRTPDTFDPGEDREVTEINGIEIEALVPEDDFYRPRKRVFVSADDALAEKIINWLRQNRAAQESMLEIAEAEQE